MGNEKSRTSKYEAQESPAAWFVVLEEARRANDYERAAHAIRELKRLGVSVKYIRRKKGDHRD